MNRHTPNDYAWMNAAVMASIMLVLLILIGMTYQLNRARIDNNQQQTTKALLQNILPTPYDNEPISDAVNWRTGRTFSREQDFTVYRARHRGRPAGVVLMPVVTTGYNGRIELVIGIDANGHITGVRVLSHHETAGLGAGIDQSESDWIQQFRGNSLDNPPAGEWKLASKGGTFDGLSGATVSPRAVITAVRHALEFYQLRKGKLYD